MAEAYLALGANIGDPEAQLEDALDHLSAHPLIALTETSDTMVNPAWGKTDQPDFHNLVAGIKTDLSPQDLLDACQMIETAMGRVRTEPWGPRLIDIDIISYDRELIASEHLTVPHPLAHERDFVMRPLRQISPQTADWIASLKA